MGEEDDDYLSEGKKHFEKGTEALLKHGIEKSKKQRKKIDYYRQNRNEFVKAISSIEAKEPAVAGTIVVAPILITLLVVDWLFSKIAEIPGNTYFDITNHYYINQSFKLGILLVFGAVIVTGVGRAVRTSKGFEAEKMVDSGFEKIPFLGSVYNISKITFDTVLSGAEEFREPVKIDLNGLRVTGFKTGNKTEDERDVVFVPTAPNITSGFVVELDEERFSESDENAEQALTRILSAGFGEPDKEEPQRTKEEN